MEGSGPSPRQLAHSINKLNFSCSEELAIVYLWLRACTQTSAQRFPAPPSWSWIIVPVILKSVFGACVEADEWCGGSWVFLGESGQTLSVCGTERGKVISYLEKSVKCYTTCSQGYLLMLFKQVK